MLQAQKRELLALPSLGENSVASLKDRLWKLESSALEQQQIQNQQKNTIQQLEQVGKLSLASAAVEDVIKIQPGHLTQLLPSLLWLPVTPEDR